MSDYSQIDCKSESHSYGALFAKEKVTTNICLVNMGAKKVGLTYESKFSGIKSGDVHGGPFEVDDNMSKTLNNSPKVQLAISGYQNTGSYASMHVKITVDIPVLGTKTIYDKTLGGNYSASSTGWATALASVAETVEQANSAG